MRALRTTLSFRETISISKETILITVLLTLGLVWINPLGIFYNITWLLPFFISLLVIYFFSKATHPQANPTKPYFQMTRTNWSPVTCHFSQPKTVSQLLNHFGTQVTYHTIEFEEPKIVKVQK